VDSRFTPQHRGGSGPPLVCLHGFTDTWRTWELVLPELERHHDVLAPTLLGHAGGPAIDGDEVAADTVRRSAARESSPRAWRAIGWRPE
jgi:pimeloyl-ACP methyl ester carboxylesterase